VLPTGRLFGRISQKGPNKKWSTAGQFRGRILADFEQKGPKRGRILRKFSPPIFFSYSREASKKKCYFPTHTDKNSVLLKTKFLQKGKITGDRIFFLSGRIFLLDWPKSSAKSWQHWHYAFAAGCLYIVYKRTRNL
jgi:hypothetical protein